MSWLQSRLPEYLDTALKSDSFGRSSAHLSPSNKLLVAWYDEFRVKFRDELDGLGLTSDVERNTFRQWFHNHKYRARAKMGKPAPPPSMLSFLGKPTEVSGRSLFKASIREEVSAEVTEERRSTGADNKAHCGMLNRELKRRWEALSPETQQEYEEKATLENASLAPQVDRNQNLFLDNIDTQLDALLGSGDAQLGNGAFLLFYALRQENEKLRIGSIQANVGNDDIPSFGREFEGFRAMGKAWGAYAEKIVPLNQPIEARDAPSAFSFDQDDSGCPAWPKDWEDRSASDLKTTLHDFIVAQWCYALPPESARSPPPWAVLAQYLGQQLPSSLILRDPRPEKISYCSALAEAFDGLRAGNPFFRLFQTQPLQQGGDSALDSHDLDGISPTALDYYRMPQRRDVDCSTLPEDSASKRRATPADIPSIRQTLSPLPPMPNSPAPPSSMHPPSLPASSSSQPSPPWDVTNPSHSHPDARGSHVSFDAPGAALANRLPTIGNVGTHPPSTPTRSSTTFGVTGRRDYSPRKKAAQLREAGRAGQQHSDSTDVPTDLEQGATEAGATRPVEEPEGRAEGTRGKRQKLAESSVKRATRQRAPAAPVADTTPSASVPATRRSKRKRNQEQIAVPARTEEDDEDNAIIVTARGKRTKKKAKHWVYELVQD